MDVRSPYAKRIWHTKSAEMDSHQVQKKLDAKRKKKQKKEELKCCKEELDKLAALGVDSEYVCPSNLCKDQRRELHSYAMHCNLKPTYRKSGKFTLNFDEFFRCSNEVHYIGSDCVLVVRNSIALKGASNVCLSENAFNAMSKLRTQLPAIEVPISSTKDRKLFTYEHNTEATVPPLKKTSSKTQRNTLPVHTYRDDILRAITANQVVVISGETGMNFLLLQFSC